MFISKGFLSERFLLLSECFQNMTNRPRMERPLSASFTKIMRPVLCPFGVFGERTNHIREVFGVFQNQTGCSASYQCIRNGFKNYFAHVQNNCHRPSKYDACFPNVLRTCCMLLERFPNTPRIQFGAVFGRCEKMILNMHNTFLTYKMPFCVHPYGAAQPVCSQNTNNVT